MKRPWYLTLLLALSLLGAVFQAFSANSVTKLMPNFPAWYPMVLMGLAAVDFVAVIMIWKWKIMGFYLSVGVTAISVVFSLIYAGSAGMGAVIFGIIGVALLYFAMRPVWKNFS